MPTYETLFITLPNLSDEEERGVVSTLALVVTDGAVMVANERMGRRRLAYPIKKHEDGVYTRFLYDSSEAVPRELERRFRISDKVLRHITVRLEDDWAVAAKEQAVRDAEARALAEVEAARAAEAAAAAAAAGIAVGPTEPATGAPALATGFPEAREDEGEDEDEEATSASDDRS